VTTEAGSSVGHVSWSPSDSPSDTVSTVRYVVTLDDAEVGTTYATEFEVAQPGNGPHTVTVTPVDEAGNRGPSQSVHVLVRSLQSGWTILAGGPGSSTGGLTLFGWNGSSYASLNAASMSAGQGYWCKAASSGNATLVAVAAPVSVSLTAGWNLIGNPTSATVNLPSGLTVFRFVNGSYVSANSLAPGEGGWVKSTSDQVIQLE
jgi:hypothetical protein